MKYFSPRNSTKNCILAHPDNREDRHRYGPVTLPQWCKRFRLQPYRCSLYLKCDAVEPQLLTSPTNINFIRVCTKFKYIEINFLADLNIINIPKHLKTILTFYTFLTLFYSSKFKRLFSWIFDHYLLIEQLSDAGQRHGPGRGAIGGQHRLRLLFRANGTHRESVRLQLLLCFCPF